MQRFVNEDGIVMMYDPRNPNAPARPLIDQTTGEPMRAQDRQQYGMGAMLGSPYGQYGGGVPTARAPGGNQSVAPGQAGKNPEDEIAERFGF